MEPNGVHSRHRAHIDRSETGRGVCSSWRAAAATHCAIRMHETWVGVTLASPRPLQTTRVQIVARRPPPGTHKLEGSVGRASPTDQRCGTPVRAEKTDGVELCGSKAKRTHDDRCSRRYGLRTRARRESLSARLLAREWLPLLATPLCNGAYATAASAVAADASWHKLEASQVEVGLPGTVRAACACLSPPGALHGLPCRVTPLRAAAREPVRLASRAAVALRLASHRQRGRPPPL
mmetsp:Transcript_46095/g.103862  ORF Transcript_46095/g.103862 Transcript_46095/m.103862 type:complete len:236 (+) Transcript_46095:644-1351(+)